MRSEVQIHHCQVVNEKPQFEYHISGFMAPKFIYYQLHNIAQVNKFSDIYGTPIY